MNEPTMSDLLEAIRENTNSQRENTEALRAVLAASGTATAPTPAPEPTKAKAPKKTAPLAVEPTPEPEPPAPEDETPTPTPAPIAAAKDTPHVPAPVAPGQPEAGEYVDVDEVISEIQKVVKDKMMTGDTEQVKTDWATYRKGLGVDRVAELRNEPAKLIAALAKAKAL